MRMPPRCIGVTHQALPIPQTARLQHDCAAALPDARLDSDVDPAVPAHRGKNVEARVPLIGERAAATGRAVNSVAATCAREVGEPLLGQIVHPGPLQRCMLDASRQRWTGM